MNEISDIDVLTAWLDPLPEVSDVAMQPSWVDNDLRTSWRCQGRLFEGPRTGFAVIFMAKATRLAAAAEIARISSANLYGRDVAVSGAGVMAENCLLGGAAWRRPAMRVPVETGGIGSGRGTA